MKVVAMRQANNLHTLCEQVFGPYLKDRTSSVRKGITEEEAKDAQKNLYWHIPRCNSTFA